MSPNLCCSGILFIWVSLTKHYTFIILIVQRQLNEKNDQLRDVSEKLTFLELSLAGQVGIVVVQSTWICIISRNFFLVTRMLIKVQTSRACRRTVCSFARYISIFPCTQHCNVDCFVVGIESGLEGMTRTWTHRIWTRYQRTRTWTPYYSDYIVTSAKMH